jgi:glutathionyl-hydroquinone reductase
VDGVRCNGEWNSKLDPRIHVQVVIDLIPEKTEQIVLENFDYINASIKNGVYHRNFSSCVKLMENAHSIIFAIRTAWMGLLSWRKNEL